MLKPRSPDAPPLESIPVPAQMSSKTALLAGLVLGVTVMVLIAGLLAFREKMSSEQIDETRANEADAARTATDRDATPAIDASPAATPVIDAAVPRDARAHTGTR